MRFPRVYLLACGMLTCAALACAMLATPVRADAVAEPAGADLAGATASGCAGREPTGLRFARQRGQAAGWLRWRAPLMRPIDARYRVYRNGAVVGQTRGLSHWLRARPGRRHMFMVRVVTSSGRVIPCAGRLRRTVSYRAPRAPRRLAASRVTDRSVRLRWTPARGGEARVAGYRVFRDGATLRQIKRRNARVRLSSGRRYRLAVAGVDGSGHVGRRRAVMVSTKHFPPLSPGALGASDVTDTEVTLKWSAGRVRSREIVGYRVYRNGTTLRQVNAGALRVTSLAPATGYTFTVASVDKIGTVSPPSAPIGVTTNLPPPTEGKAHAFLLASTDQSFRDLQAHYRQIGTLYPTYFDCRADTSIVGVDDPLVTRWAQLRKMTVMPRVNCQSESVLTRVLTNSSVRAATLQRILGLVDAHGYDGINIDFEKGNAGIRDALTSFISELATKLHARGKRLSVEVSAKRSDDATGRAEFYDYRGLAAAADTVFVMNWGLHWATSAPGSMNGLPWATQVANYAARMPHKRRFVLGTPLYGFDWAGSGGTANPGVALEHSDVMALVAATRSTPVLDPVEREWRFTYRDGRGTLHTVWYEDAITVRERMRLAHDRGMGIGFWRLGNEDQRLWDSPWLAPSVSWP